MPSSSSSLPAAIASIGQALPARVVENAELEPLLGLRDGWIFERTGIESRRWQDPAVGMVAQAVPAVNAALASAGIKASDLDLIIGASSIPQQVLPVSSCFLAHELGVDGAGCFDVNASCFSFPVALWQAAHAVARGEAERVLVWTSEVASRGLNLKEAASACLFGDGAAAVVVVPARGAFEGSAMHALHLRTWPDGRKAAEIRAGGSEILPDRPGFDPLAFKFHMNGKAIFRLALKHGPDFITEFFEKKCPILQRDMKMVIPHQTNKHGIDAFTKFLGFTPEQVFSNLPDHGNCVAAALPLALADALAAGRLQRGDNVMLVGTAAGLTLGALALTW
jgi:3-oxoacyl-[acyl-carrier-protein] synthase-3